MTMVILKMYIKVDKIYRIKTEVQLEWPESLFYVCKYNIYRYNVYI